MSLSLKRFLGAFVLLWGLTPVVSAKQVVRIDNCGQVAEYTRAPKRAMTLNQAATEIMLALGLADRLNGTAYLDDAIWPPLAEDYAKVPVIAEKYPSREVLYAAAPDFVYAAYGSAFKAEFAGPRAELAEAGIHSYLSPAACADKKATDNQALEMLYGEIRAIAAIFAVVEKGEQLIAQIEAQITEARALLNKPGQKELSIFWYDSGQDKAYVGACCGMPGAIIKAVGARNVFADQAGRWAKVSWEAVLARNPDVIVVVDASWSTAQSKIDFLRQDPAYQSLDAVKHNRFVILPFSATSAGVRNGQAILDLANGLTVGDK